MRKRSETGVWWASPHIAAAIALMPTVLAIFVIVHELTLHAALGGVTLEPAGTNFASSVSLSTGQLLYNNYPNSFPLTQPPGMSVLLLPFAWVTHGGDASGAMAAARIFTAAVSIINVFLVGLTARRHGIASTFVAGVLFAVFPFAFYATSSYMLEPFLVLFCLLAFQAAFSQGEMVTGGRLILAGALVGFAISIKPWALIPAIVLLVCAAFNWRQALARVGAGILGGIAVPCVLFFLASPSSFLHDVVSAELGSGGSRSGTMSSRIAEILGLGAPIGVTRPNTLALAIGAILLILVLVAALGRASTSSIADWAILGTTVGLVVIALLPASLPVAYTYFLAAFGAIVVGNTIGTILSMISSISVGTGDVSSTVAGGVTILVVAAMIAVIAVAAPKEATFEHNYFAANGSNPSAAIDSVVPKGSCVISNDPEALVVANRFAELPAGCPVLPDPAGIVKAAGSPAAGSRNQTVVAQWEQAFTLAHFFVEAPGSVQVPWSPALQAFFGKNYTLVHNAAFKIYENKAPSLP
jgi:alpha-1,2-mannosyltransferase